MAISTHARDANRDGLMIAPRGSVEAKNYTQRIKIRCPHCAQVIALVFDSKKTMPEFAVVKDG